MNLLYIANIRLPTEKAHSVHIMKMCEALAKAGVSVELVVSNRRTPIAANPFKYYGVDPIFTITYLPTVNTVRFGKIGFWIQMISFALQVTRRMRRSGAKFFYFRDLPLLSFCRFPKDKVFIWEIHERIHLTKRLLKKIHRLDAHFACITLGVKNMLLQNGIEERSMILAPDAADLARFDIKDDKKELRQMLALPLSQKLAGYVGKLSTSGKSKGVEEIIEAVAKLHKMDKNIGLLLVGINPEEMTRVRNLASRTGLPSEAVHLITHVEHAKISQYLKAADVLLMNYPNQEHYALFMSPLKLFEYMASGTPIVTSDLPSIREILDDSMARFVLPDNTASLAEGIAAVLQDPVYGSEIAQKARKESSQYSWDARARHVLSELTKRV